MEVLTDWTLAGNCKKGCEDSEVWLARRAVIIWKEKLKGKEDIWV